MKSMKTLGITVLAVASALASGCGGRAGAQSPAQAASVVSLASGFLTSMRFNNSPQTMVGSAAQGFSGRPSGSGKAAVCGSTATPATGVDADGDGIALTQAWTYDYDSVSCGTGDPDIHWQFSGTSTATDLDDTKKWMIGGYQYVWDFASSYSQPGGTSGGHTFPASSYSYVGDGTYTARKVGSSYVHQADYDGNVTFTYGSYNGSFMYEGEFRHVVTPDSELDSLAWQSGAIQINGTWTYSGQMISDEEHGSGSLQNVDITFTATSSGLRYDTTCSNYWSEGSFFFDVGGGHTYEMRYSCTGVTYYYDGVLYDPTA